MNRPDEPRRTGDTDSDAEGLLDLEALLVAAGAGDHAAFDDLYVRLHPLVVKVAARVVKSQALAEEVAHEVFLWVWQHGSKYDAGKGRAASWLMTLAHRRAVDVVRSAEAGHRADERQGLGEGDAFDSAVEAVIERDDVARLHRCLLQLTPLQREALSLAYFEGLTYAEVAQRLAVNLPSVKARIRDGLTRLRRCMG